MMHRVICALALIAAASGTAADDDVSSQIAKDLQGAWVGISLEIEGNKTSEEDAKAFRIAIKGDEMTLMTCKGERCIERKKKFRLNASKSPRWIDLDTLDGKEKGTTQLSIFSLNKDELKLCSAIFETAPAARPTEFKTQAGDGMMIVVLRRVESK